MNAVPNRITAVSAALTGHPAGTRAVAMRMLDLTRDLVLLVARREWALVGRLLVERRRLLGRLPEEPADEAEERTLAALRAAMAESDRTVGLLLANAELSWPACDGAGD